MGFSWTSATDPCGPVSEPRSYWSCIAGLAAALAGMAALVVVGMVTGIAVLVFGAAVAALAIWPVLQGVERRLTGQQRSFAADARRVWVSGHRRSAESVRAWAPMEGDAELLFVDMDLRTITIDGILALDGTPVGEPRQLFWLCIRRPDTGWLSASLLTTARRWIEHGHPVRVATRLTPLGMEAVLTAPGNRMVVELEDAGRIASHHPG